ncbi:MAG TPA: SCO family protein [Polyangia bacterium]|nr:SCO family protein [Polyangia bacterium]
MMRCATGRLVLAIAMLLGGCARRPPADGTGLPRLWRVPDFAYRDQSGQRVTRDGLLGHAWVADFIFTSCTSVCPVLSAQMVLLQRAVPSPDARFVSFSVDPERDTPAVVAAYAARWHADGKRWHLLVTDGKTLPALAVAMKMKVQRSEDEADTLVHSSRMQVVDASGWVRAVYDSSDAAAMTKLAADLNRLTSTGAAEPARKPDGAALYATLACAACHDRPSLAPPLAGLFGRRVTLDDGRTLTADAAYMRASLIDPNAQRVAGYNANMPSYARLRDAQLKALVTYLSSLPASLPAAASLTTVGPKP